MRRIGLVLGLLIMVSTGHAQEKVCINQAIAQTRAKISAHYANQNMTARLAHIQTVDLSGINSNGPAHKGLQYESVEYTTLIILGTIVIKGKGQFNDYAFYVRIGTDNCEVLKVALLRSGASPFLSITSAQAAKPEGGGLVSQEITAGKIETPQDGSPKIGYTYVSKGEVSQPVENDHYLQFLQQRAEQLVERF